METTINDIYNGKTYCRSEIAERIITLNIGGNFHYGQGFRIRRVGLSEYDYEQDNVLLSLSLDIVQAIEQVITDLS